MNDEKTFESSFDAYLQATTAKSILSRFHLLCSCLSLNLVDDFYESKKKRLTHQRLVYRKIKEHKDACNYWRANKLWEKFDKRLEHSDYLFNDGDDDFHVLIIGCGPVGLRLSIECALMGLKCTILEKRDK